MNLCIYCDQPSVGYTQPALCDLHLDLWLLADRLQETGQPVTVASLKALRAQSLSRGGEWTITEADIETGLAGEFGKQYQMERVVALNSEGEN